ncbi:MAG: tetratricopeptide repeat protein, partial [Planctomycetota bacterium]
DAIERAKAWLARNEAADDPIPGKQIVARLVGLYHLAGYYEQCHELLDKMLAETGDAGDRLNLIIQKLAALVDAGDAQAARELYLRTSPDTYEFPAAREVLLMLLVRSHQVDVALGVLDDALDAAAGNSERRFELRARQIAVCVEAEQYDRAYRMLDEWVADRPGAYRAAYQALRIDVYVEAGRLDDAIAYVTDGADRLVRQQVIDHLVDAERFDDVRRLGAAWARQDPTDRPLLRYCVGHLQLADQDDLALALLADWDDALAPAPDAEPAPTVTTDPIVLARRYVRDTYVLMLILADRLDEAAQLGRRFVDDDPNSVYQRLRYSTVLDQQERFDEAASQLAVAAQAVRDDAFLTDALPPEHPAPDSILPSRGEELARRMQLKASVLNNLGYLYAEMGIRLDEAEEMIRESLQMEETVNSLDSLAWVHYKRGRFDRAEHVFTRALAASRSEAENGREEHPLIYDHAGDNLYRLGRTDEAVALWRRAMELAETAEPSRDIDNILSNTPAKLAAAESGQMPPVAPLGEGVDDPLNPAPDAATETQDE